MQAYSNEVQSRCAIEWLTTRDSQFYCPIEYDKNSCTSEKERERERERAGESGDFVYLSVDARHASSIKYLCYSSGSSIRAAVVTHTRRWYVYPRPVV